MSVATPRPAQILKSWYPSALGEWLSLAQRINAKRVFKFIGGMVLALPAVLLLAFGPRSSSDVPPDRTVVVYWEKWTDFEGEAMRRLCGVFNDTVGAQRGIFVQYVTTTQIELKTLVAAAGGDPPDLAGLWADRMPSYVAMGAMSPLDERAAGTVINDQTIIPAYFNANQYHGHLYAVTLTPWSLALYYNKDLFAQYAEQLAAVGLSADRAPRTTDELLRYCRVLQRRDARGNIEMLGYIPGSPWPIGWYWLTWPLWFGGSLQDPQTGYMRVDTPECIASFEWVQNFAREFGFDAVQNFESSFANFNSPDNPFMIGQLAMMRQGPWFANMIQQYAPELEFSAAPFPTVDGREVGYIGQDVLAIPGSAKHPDEAWAFIEWLYTSPPINVPSGKAEPERGYEYYVAAGPNGPAKRPMPPLRPIEWICWIHYKNCPLVQPSTEFTSTHPNPVLAVHDRLARGKIVVSDPPLPNWTELRATFESAYRDIWTGAANATDRLKQCQKRIDTLSELARRGLERYGETYP